MSMESRCPYPFPFQVQYWKVSLPLSCELAWLAVTLVHDGQVQHDVGLADRAAAKAVNHLNVTLMLASTGGDLDLRSDRVPG